eukprot:CAMPEP_0184383876 /NCGR_PEP_ID=MMETSP0007-20130409/7479_1 /TAXON_ID=97485 /ORGANISM="Prymnesium parvum, Strain Texoma1" /LENGTH=483 /DNA_ID=CAMNT_0026730539 /DNA_START=53 /DNA_END=1504 /DNA_ORIENTATION=+
MFMFAASLAIHSPPPLHERYTCAARASMAEVEGLDCTAISACHLLRSSQPSHCPGPDSLSSSSASPVQLRVAKGFGTKPYSTLRVSVVEDAGSPPLNSSQFDYSAMFRYKWRANRLHSSVVSVPPGEPSPITLAPGITAQLNLPAQGSGVAGVLLADPCVHGSAVTCLFERRYQTTSRTPALLNAFVARDTDYWGILGDNFYDQDGSVTKSFFSQLSLTTLSTIFVSVAGNHDYWVLGSPWLGTVADQYGNGHMQYYAQDTLAAKHLQPGSRTPPFNFSVDPKKGHSILGGNLPAISNSFFYHQIGNVGIIGFSGAYTLDELSPLMKEACAWLPTQPGLRLAVLVGHWDKPGAGATVDTAAPSMYEHVRSLPGCDAFDGDGMLKFVMGHTHCNIPHPHGNVNTGFMVAGFGMEGCGNYGVPILDTTNDRVTFFYFPIGDLTGTDNYAQTMDCVTKNGWRACTHLAEKWLDEPLAKRPAMDDVL